MAHLFLPHNPALIFLLSSAVIEYNLVWRRSDEPVTRSAFARHLRRPAREPSHHYRVCTRHFIRRVRHLQRDVSPPTTVAQAHPMQGTSPARRGQREPLVRFPSPSHVDLDEGRARHTARRIACPSAHIFWAFIRSGTTHFSAGTCFLLSWARRCDPAVDLDMMHLRRCFLLRGRVPWSSPCSARSLGPSGRQWHVLAREGYSLKNKNSCASVPGRAQCESAQASPSDQVSTAWAQQ
ncbi:hypothetical protein C8R44DRAFT_886433 [Mycena epipterygia]|nr:hypothetical protein C8R44DRAFT_886433 [Mycena epipterygia]